jgi:Flp pilus assembly protein TadD
MILFVASAAALLAAAGVPDSFDEAEHAIAANRLVQARHMLADALSAGRQGPKVDQLIADLAFADGRWAEAQARYTQLLKNDPSDVRSAERAARSSLMLGNSAPARTLLRTAISSGRASWQTWNAMGVLCDGEGDWDGADAAYASADELSPDQPEVLNNHGWSLILRGEWAGAVLVLQKARELDPRSERIANNLELAQAAVSADLPKRRPRESDSDFAARLNDAGIAAERRGERDRAIAAFSRALAVSDSWFARAANNLARMEQK